MCSKNNDKADGMFSDWNDLSYDTCSVTSGKGDVARALHQSCTNPEPRFMDNHVPSVQRDSKDGLLSKPKFHSKHSKMRLRLDRMFTHCHQPRVTIRCPYLILHL
ncbi:hypothetical protein CHS0354_016055 [Potamilus streckersoni]|uniref:Uncharacterized protein n=1 Tax=Potamilus streckersoni TaxID=2493646 RepID=A0AAE0W608_9BIVA|nr:hypothetical protein CHS0354_016055 [Potamilus streckersoni]